MPTYLMNIPSYIPSFCNSHFHAGITLISFQEYPEETIEEVVNEVEEPVTNPEVIEPTEESAVTEQPELDIFNKKNRKKKNI